MTLLHPSYLWGLLALAVPIAIHLWSRKKVRTVKVGSTQFIAETKSKQSYSIQVNELWLLALRCLIIAILVGILAEPQISENVDSNDIAYVFESSLLETEEGRARFGTIPEEGRRLLQKGFPVWEVDDPISTSTEVPNYWQLAREMDQIPADSIVVFTQGYQNGIRGKRPGVQKNIHWISVDLDDPVSEAILARLKADSLEVLTVQSDASTLAFAKAKISKNEARFNTTKDSMILETPKGMRSINITNQKPITVTISYDDIMESQRDYIKAAFRAIGKYLDRNIEVQSQKTLDTTTLAKSDYIVWLRTSETPQTTTRTLRYDPDEFAQTLIEPGKTPTEYVLTKELTPEVILEEQFVAQLIKWLQIDKELESQISQWDRRSIASNQLKTKVVEEAEGVKKVVKAQLSNRLWMLLLFLIVGERILARIRKQ